MEDPSENKENIPPYAALPSYGTLAPLPAHPSRPTLPLAPPLPPHLPGSVLPLAPAVPPLQPTVLAPATAETPVPRPHHPATAVQFPSATPATATSMLSAGHTPSAPNNLTTPINNVGVSTALSQSIQGSAFKPKIYRQQIHDKDSTSKHSPISPRGTIFKLKDNPEIKANYKIPCKKGKIEPGKLDLTLKDTFGNLHKRFFPEKDEQKWEDPKWISECNRWRNQVLRRLFKHDNTFEGRGSRPKWGMRETASLKYVVKAKVEAAGNRRLTNGEWEEVVQEHNKKCGGTKVQEGERLLGGELAKTTQGIEKRTMTAIRALFERNDDLKTWLKGLVGDPESGEDAAGGLQDIKMKDDKMAALSDDEMDAERATDKEAEDEPPMKKRKLDRNGGNIDPKLEGPSDDEDEGQRPASNQTGAHLIAYA